MKARSHIFSTVSGAVAGLVYQRSRDSAIFVRVNAGARKRTTNATVNHDSLFRVANRRWRALSDTIRSDWQRFAILRPSPVTGVKHDDSDAGRRAFISAFVWARLTGGLSDNPTDTQLQPLLSSTLPFVRSHVLTYPAAGQIRVTLNKSASNVMYSRGVLIGPFDQSVIARPRGWNANLAIISAAAAASPNVITWTNLISGRIYFLMIRTVLSQSGLAPIGLFEARALTT